MCSTCYQRWQRTAVTIEPALTTARTCARCGGRADGGLCLDCRDVAADLDETASWSAAVLPYHLRDDGTWCPFSLCTSRAGSCPNGCEGALSHYSNDGHPDCQEV
jgi:hypothetical protein